MHKFIPTFWWIFFLLLVSHKDHWFCLMLLNLLEWSVVIFLFLGIFIDLHLYCHLYCPFWCCFHSVKVHCIWSFQLMSMCACFIAIFFSNFVWSWRSSYQYQQGRVGRVWILLMVRCTRYNIMWCLSVNCGRSVVFAGYSGFYYQ